MSNCLFCKIALGEIPAEKVYETETIYAFRDINPQAPNHILVIPKKHIDRIENLPETETKIGSDLLLAAKQIAREQGLKNGFRIVINNGKEGGQEVEHIHLHLLGGRMMKWPPG